MNRHGVSGMMSDVGDWESMGEQAAYILSQPERFQRFREQALEQARAFELDRVLPMYEALYESVLVAKPVSQHPPLL